MSDMPLPPAGWYLDPDQPAFQRYWDGQQWTTNIAPAPSSATTVEPPASPPTPDFVPESATSFTPEPLPDADPADGPSRAAAAVSEPSTVQPGGAHWSPATRIAPATTRPPTKSLGKGAIVAIILGAVALAIGTSWLLGSSSMTANLQDGAETIAKVATGSGQAADSAARNDIRSLAIQVLQYTVESQDAPTVTSTGGEYVISGPHGEYARMPIAAGVEFGGWEATSIDDWCVWVRAPHGNDKNFENSAEGGSAAGNCS